jgi:hypothetical protein
LSSVADPHRFDPDPDPASHFDADLAPDPTFHFEVDPDPDPTFHFDPYPSFQIKAQNPEQVLKYAHIPYILACYLQIDADADPDLDPDPYPTFQFDADPSGSGSTALISRPYLFRPLVTCESGEEKEEEEGAA